jgi:hypothetical protein
VGYRTEGARGYESRGDLWSPGYFRADLGVGEAVTLIASTESWETVIALDPTAALEAERRGCAGWWPPRIPRRARAWGPSWCSPRISSSSRRWARARRRARASGR